jgi:hypothetical protein
LALAVVFVLTPSADASGNVIDLAACHLTVHFLSEPDKARMTDEGWLPSAYTSADAPGAPGAASLGFWVFDCADVRIDGTAVGEARISLVGIQIMDRLAHHIAAYHWDHYLVWAHSDNETVIEMLEGAGLPAISVPSMAFDWRADGVTTNASIPWADSPYDLSVRGRVEDVPHLHDNTFQHGDEPGAGPGLHLVIDPLVPRDRFCVTAIEPDCATVGSQPGTTMARFLGSADIWAAADHEAISNAQIHVVARQMPEGRL